MAVVSASLVLLGSAEVMTGFRHEFLGLTTSRAASATYAGAAIGLLCLLAGLLILTGRRWAAVAAVVLLCGDVAGRVAMVVTGLYPVGTFRQAFAIIVGTSIAAAFAVYLGLKSRHLD